jgi:hypothetical protein
MKIPLNRMILPKTIISDLLTEITPPIRYPRLNPAMITPMRLDQTKTEVPKYGPSIREPAISIIIVQAPAKKMINPATNLFMPALP